MNKQKNPMQKESVLIREMRAKTGLTQREFGDMFNIPVNNIQKWEQGINKPTEYTLKMMIRIMNMTEEIDKLKHTTNNSRI